MSIIYIGSIYPPGQIEKLKSFGSSIDFAADTFQISLLEGLFCYYRDMKIITSPNISNYPKVKKKLFSKKEFQLSYNKQKHIFTGFVNIPILKHISKLVRISREIKKSIDKDSDNRIIIYGVGSPSLLALYYINKRRYKSCLIVPDLPEFMSDKKKLSYLIGKKIDKLFINLGIRKIDSFVLFSPYMKERFPVYNKPWIHLEGVFSKTKTFSLEEKKENYRTILYSGSLSKRYGIMDLVKAFNLIDKDNYRLWICGGGDALSEIKDFEKIDKRIQYLGLLSKEEVRRKQKQATLLINPRHKIDEYTKYSFPSKTMEYMASGTPVLMSHLLSIPSEYEKHLYFFDDESIEGMKNKIIEICEKSQEELNAFGKAASKFIINEKNEKKQANRIVELLKEI
jgi:glycosyltransferase involved in cell wall biosynthesis